MAEAKTKLEAIGLTRGKATLVCVLAIAFAGVLYRQFAGSGADAKKARSASAAQAAPALPSSTPAVQAPTAAGTADASLEVALSDVDEAKWKCQKLDDAIAFDPFALPKAFPQPQRAVLDPTLAAEGGEVASAAQQAEQLAEAVELMQNQLVELQQRGVHVIVNLNDEYVAMIGDRTIHVGDEINGFVVTAIEPDGVRVERKAVQ